MKKAHWSLQSSFLEIHQVYKFSAVLALVLMLAYEILQPRRLHFLLLQQKDEVNWVVVHQHFSLNNRQNGV